MGEIRAVAWPWASLCYPWDPPGKWPKTSRLRPDPMSAASENTLTATFPEAVAWGYRDTAQHVHLSFSNPVSWVGDSSRSGCLVTQVPSSVGLYCQGSEVPSWGPLTWASSLHTAPQGHLWAADRSPPPRAMSTHWDTNTTHPIAWGGLGAARAPALRTQQGSDPAPPCQ